MADLLDRAPKALAALTTFTLVTTVVHDWGWFSVIGSEFQSLQTPYDYLAHALAWLPLNLLGLVGMIVLSRALNRLLSATHDEWNNGFGDHQNKAARKHLKRISIYILLLCSISFLVCLTIPSDRPDLIIVTLSILWLALFCRLYLSIESLRKLSRLAVITIMALPLLGALLFTSGLSDARQILHRTNAVYHLFLKDGRSQTINLLRNLDKGALIHDPTRSRVILIRWDQIDRLERFVSTKREETLGCRTIGLGCSTSPSP
ncbi:hypothetical protein RPMA_12280 [Tardiphaga alba]|uniref:Uncharacterized protein n=1 Tax=Tardiphaga alba TaxID=340268 RepID=A0ABX8A725_9BRAD|nr:hypothetical protein [Tardiphaga alba]QUS39524.1 hypothetical protein RPMA_12280 [Tardiphaga alba]